MAPRAISFSAAYVRYLGEVAQDPPPVDEVDLQDVGKGLLVETQQLAELTDADSVGLRDVAEDRNLAEGALWLQHQQSLLLAVFTNANTFLQRATACIKHTDSDSLKHGEMLMETSDACRMRWNSPVHRSRQSITDQPRFLAPK